MRVPVEQAAINLASAVVFGSVIGFERQWRHRLAGLRTNTLVALGAASFVVFEALVSNESGPTRIATEVVSGIGFLGAGVIFREGLNVRGLNTAAPLVFRPRRRSGRRSMARCDSDGVHCLGESVVASNRKLHQPTAAGLDRTRDRICRVDHLP
jgi:MgtC family